MSSYDGAHEALQTDEDVIRVHFELLAVLLRQEGPYTPPADDSYADPEITSWIAEASSVCHYALEGDNEQDYLVGRLRELGGYVSPSLLCSDCGKRLSDEELQRPLEAGEWGSPLCNPCADPVPMEANDG